MRRSVLLAAVAAVAALSCARAEGERVALDLTGPRPVVEFTIAGRSPARAIFDTGASGSVLDRAFAESAGLPNEQPVRVGSGAGGPPIEGYLTTIATMSVGGAVLEGVKAAVLDLPLPEDNGDVVAVLSPNIFAGKYVAFDFGAGALVLRDKDGALPPGTASSYTDSERPLPAIPVSVAGATHEAHIDTGAPRALTFPYEMAGSLPLAGPPEAAGTARIATGERKLYRGKIDGVVTVGPLTL